MIEDEANIIIGHIEQIINDNTLVGGKVSITTERRSDSYIKSLVIKTNNKSFQEDLEIDVEKEPELYQSLLEKLINRFAFSDYIGISECQYMIPSEPIIVPRWITISNVNTTRCLQLELFVSNKNSHNIIREYNDRLKQIGNEQQSNRLL